MAAHRLRRRERHFASTCTGPLLGTARRVYSGRRRDRTRLTRMRRARPRVIGTAECIDPLPKHRRRTAFPGFPLIDDGLSRGAHPGRELRLTQAEAPAHGLDADVVVDRHRRPSEGGTTIGWANRPPIVRLPKRDRRARTPSDERRRVSYPVSDSMSCKRIGCVTTAAQSYLYPTRRIG